MRSFKAYGHITRAELKELIEASHARAAKVTGHLCPIGFSEVAEMGIDNIEDGFLLDTEFNPAKAHDVCPPGGHRTLVRRHVALTSTLPVFEQCIRNPPSVEDRVLTAMAPASRASCLAQRQESATASSHFDVIFSKEMDLERKFVAAGGMLVAGGRSDGNGCVISGFGDQRELELLVQAGFSPAEGIRIAILNGTEFLGIEGQTGSIAPIKRADLLVFKGGIEYDPNALITPVKGLIGSSV